MLMHRLMVSSDGLSAKYIIGENRTRRLLRKRIDWVAALSICTSGTAAKRKKHSGVDATWCSTASMPAKGSTASKPKAFAMFVKAAPDPSPDPTT
jgi:hypothetical protein